jgi:hypothetical protein
MSQSGQTALRSKSDIFLEVNLLDAPFGSNLTNSLPSASTFGTSFSLEQATAIFNCIAATINPAARGIKIKAR